jgi:multiple sugar transport system permease protein
MLNSEAGMLPKITQKKNNHYLRKAQPYLLLTPALLFVLLIVVYPVLCTFYYSVTDYKIWSSNNIKFIGLSNYTKLFHDPVFLQASLNTLKWVVIVLIVQFLLGLGIALLLNMNFKFRLIARGLVLIPWITPSIMTSLMWMWMYNGNFGIINYILQALHLTKQFIPFLSQTSTAIYSVMFTYIWQGVPYFALMLTAGLSGISPVLYEASSVDGANHWNAFWHITLPSLKNIIFITTLLRMIWIANNVDLIYMMTGGGPADSTMTLSVLSFVTAQKGFDFGYASAISVCLSVCLLFVAFFYIKKMNPRGDTL